MAIKNLVVMTALPTDNEQTGVSPRPSPGAATYHSREFGEFSRLARALFMLDVTAKSGTNPTLDVTIEGWDATAGKWRTITTFAQILGASVPVTPDAVEVDPLYYEIIRATWVIGGTASPGFTFTLAAQGLTEEALA